jgi:hypothetical protein
MRTTEICERAADLDPAILRSLDALHLASDLRLADDWRMSSPTSRWSWRLACMESQSWHPAGSECFGDAWAEYRPTLSVIT